MAQFLLKRETMRAYYAGVHETYGPEWTPYIDRARTFATKAEALDLRKTIKRGGAYYWADIDRGEETTMNITCYVCEKEVGYAECVIWYPIAVCRTCDARPIGPNKIILPTLAPKPV